MRVAETASNIPLKSPYAIVFGSSGVLGSAVANQLLQSGWHVLGTGFRRSPSFQPSIQLDLTQSSEMEKLGEWIWKNTERLDAVIHCVGTLQDRLITHMSEESWKSVLDVHLKSAFLTSNLLLPKLAKQRSGKMIFIGSWAGRVGRMGQSNYAAAKAGLIGLSQSIAREYASRGIVSNCVIPGVFKSPMTEKLSDDQLEKLWEGAALKQFSDIHETVNFIIHLASMSGATGQVFQLDGRIPPAF